MIVREMAGTVANVALRNVFVYGSLLAPEVVSALLHRAPSSSLALVHDYHRYSIKDRIYPAVLAAKGNKVFGKVLYDLTDIELQVLDDFEDIEYKKVVVSPLLLNAVNSVTKPEPAGPGASDIAGEVTVGASHEQEANAMTVATNKKETNIHTERDTVDAENEYVHVGEVGTTLQAYMYIWANQNDPDLVGNWDYEVWRKNHLDDYVKMCEDFECELSNLWDLHHRDD